jgi:curli production assembly/transport component CsgG/holdfast attachment protein HfaB
MPALKQIALLAATTALTACVSPSAGVHTGLYASPIGDAPVTANPTAYTPALNCLADYAQSHNISPPRIAVGRILDYTGAVSDEGGRTITQGASLMAMSAFAKSGARLVERFDTSVTELELRYANNRLIGQDTPQAASPSEARGGAQTGELAGGPSAGPYDDSVRRIYAGQMPGSDYYFVGGITELNSDIRSSGVDMNGGHTNAQTGTGQLGGRLFVMNIGLDFRLIDTRTLEVVDVISYQKQIVGREIRAGVFSFMGDHNFLDLSGGERALEPVHLAVRAGVERAVVEVMSNLYRVQNSQVCKGALASEGDPMGPAQATGSFITNAQGPQLADARTQRAAPNAWDANRDDNLSGIRGTEASADAADRRSNVDTRPHH